jgi:hypothetical protein
MIIQKMDTNPTTTSEKLKSNDEFPHNKNDELPHKKDSFIDDNSFLPDKTNSHFVISI